MTTKFDAIVVGGGHNGLVCSALLEKSGKQVLLLEANDQVGGTGTGGNEIEDEPPRIELGSANR